MTRRPSAGPLARRAAAFAALAVLAWALLEGSARLAAGDQALTFFAPGGLALAAFLRWRRGRWPEAALALAAGAVAFALRANRAPAEALAWTAADLASAAAAALATRRLLGGRPSLERLRDATTFVVASVVATLGAAAASVAWAAQRAAALPAFRTIWASDLLGALVVAPLLLALAEAQRAAAAATRRGRLEMTAAFAAVAAAVALTFHAGTPFPLPLGVPALALLWTAFRLGPRASAASVALMTAIVLWASAGRSLAPLPSLGVPAPGASWEIRGFLAMTAITMLVLAALSDERARLIDRLEREVRVLTGLLPICAHCKKIRDDANAWHPLETFLERHTQATFTHGICPACLARHYGDWREPP